MNILLTALISFSVFQSHFNVVRKAEMRTSKDSTAIVLEEAKGTPVGYTRMGTVSVVNIVSLGDTFVFTSEYIMNATVSDIISGFKAREGDKSYKALFDGFEIVFSDSRGKTVYPVLKKTDPNYYKQMQLPAANKLPVVNKPPVVNKLPAAEQPKK